MAIYIYADATGVLVSWCPSDDDPVASDEELSAQGYAKQSGLAPLDSSHVWDAGLRTVVEIEAPLPLKPVKTAEWLMRLTPQEFVAINSSNDPVVQQNMYALNHTTDINLNQPLVQSLVDYLVEIGLLTASRRKAMLA